MATRRRRLAVWVGLALGVAGCASGVAPDEATGVAEEEIVIGPAPAVPMLGGRGPVSQGLVAAGVEDYQLGDTWGKAPVTSASLSTRSAAFQRAAKATARVNGATGFYLGVFNGHHVMGTNHHVMPSTSACSGSTVRFPLLGNAAFSCVKVFGSWTDVDLTLFEIRVRTRRDAARLAAVAEGFAFADPLVAGQELATVGFGAANNASGEMVGTDDADCRVMSVTGDVRFMADPDRVDPGPYSTWSFAHACDVSHGDSGSAVVDRATGKVVGLVWTGAIPKVARVQDSAYLGQLLASSGADVWTELNYAVPAAKIRDVLTTAIARPQTSRDTRATFRAMLN